MKVTSEIHRAAANDTSNTPTLPWQLVERLQRGTVRCSFHTVKHRKDTLVAPHLVHALQQDVLPHVFGDERLASPMGFGIQQLDVGVFSGQC